jgi:Ca2+-binding EF-hand superfamily protein
MKPFKKIAIAALAASVAGTALTAGLSASAQDTAASADGGKQMEQADGQRFAHMGERGGRGWGRGHGGDWGGHRGGHHRAERLFERFDVNEDGVITEAEIEEVRARDFSSADADGNGEVSLEEFKAAFMERSNDRMVRAFQFLDRDGDGTVTQEEIDQVANRMFNRLDRDGNGTVERMHGARADRDDDDDRGRHHGPHRGRGGPGGMFLSVFDSDGDGQVNRDEFDAKRAELFALADTDGSGSFTLEDFGPLWLALNENRIVDMFQRADADGSLGVSPDEHDQRLDRLMERADRNQDGVITKADFKGGKKGKGKGHGKGWRHHDRG